MVISKNRKFAIIRSIIVSTIIVATIILTLSNGSQITGNVTSNGSEDNAAQQEKIKASNLTKIPKESENEESNTDYEKTTESSDSDSKSKSKSSSNNNPVEDSNGDGDSGGSENTPECTTDDECTTSGVCGTSFCNESSMCEISYNESTDICRATTGECDQAEFCTGSSIDCPEDSFNSSGTPCSTGECDGIGNCIQILDTTNILSCQILDQPNTTYTLNESISDFTNDTCINITATNITLDCNNNQISTTEFKKAIFSNQEYTTIKNCQIATGVQEPGIAIELSSANYSTIQENQITSGFIGVFSHDKTKELTIQGNTIQNTYSEAVYLLETHNSSINLNSFEGTSIYSILTVESNNNKIDTNYFSTGESYAISIEKGINQNLGGSNTIKSNEINGSTLGIYVETPNNTIQNNTVQKSQYYSGIYIYNTSGNSILENNATNNAEAGIKIKDSNSTRIESNKLSSNTEYGLQIKGNSNENTAFLNSIEENSQMGLYTEEAQSNNISNNRICSNALDAYCDASQLFESNSCDSQFGCGTCTECSFSASSITGNAISTENKIKNPKLISTSILIIALITTLKIIQKKH